MNTDRQVFCLVQVYHTEWVIVRAANLEEAAEKAKQLPEVLRVLETSFIPGGVIT